MNLIFQSDIHKYSILEHPEISLTSVSKLIEKVKQPFDADKWASKKAAERGITKEEVLEEWKVIKDIALTKGTKYHNEYEANLLKSKKTHPSVIDESGHKKAHDLRSLEPGVHPELILYNLNYEIVGTADIVEIFPDKSFILSDHKTSKSIDFKGFMKFDPIDKRKHEVKMLSPLSKLGDCNGNHYSIQLSLYAWMLEQFGYTCKELILHHVIFEEGEPCNVVNYPIPYLKKEVINLLNWYKSKK